MIILNKGNILAKGSERACYLDPADSTKIIKIIYNKKSKNNQNELEYKYYEYLNGKNIEFSNLARCFGWVETNLGKGLIFERILNYDGTASSNLREILQRKILFSNEEDTLLNDLNTYLESNSILFIDATSLNVLVKEESKTKRKLVIIDGIGAKREGFKFYLYLKFNFYTKYKIKKQWNVFLENIKKVKKKIELNQKL